MSLFFRIPQCIQFQQSFRSVLELILLMDSALCEAQGRMAV